MTQELDLTPAPRVLPMPSVLTTGRNLPLESLNPEDVEGSPRSCASNARNVADVCRRLATRMAKIWRLSFLLPDRTHAMCKHPATSATAREERRHDRRF